MDTFPYYGGITTTDLHVTTDGNGSTCTNVDLNNTNWTYTDHNITNQCLSANIVPGTEVTFCDEVKFANVLTDKKAEGIYHLNTEVPPEGMNHFGNGAKE